MMNSIFKSALPLTFALAGFAVVAPAAMAQDISWPDKPIRLIVGYPPGGGADAVARIYAHKLGELLKQSIIIDNKPGAGTTIAAEQAANAPGDGYTLYLGSSVLFGVDKVLYPQIRYNVSSFVPITQVTTSPLVLATRDNAPYKTAKELVDYAKQNPGKVFYTSSGNGSSPHLAAASFMEQFGVKLTHVPYKGGAQSVQAVVAKDADITFATPPSVLSMAKAGRLKAIAVTSKERSNDMPDLDTVAHQTGSNYDLSFWFGLFAPKGTPAPIVNKLYEASKSALSTSEVRKQLSAQGNEVAVSESPEQFARWVIAQGQAHAKFAKSAGVKVD